MKYIITGATGHIGNTVVKLLQSKNEKIKLLLRNDTDYKDIFDNINFEVAFGDIRDIEFLRKEIEPDSIVIHLAGIVSITEYNKKITYDINVNGTKNICDVCLEKGVKRLIYTSSVHALPTLKMGDTIREPENYEYKVKFSYSQSKKIASEYVKNMIQKGLPAIILYPSGVIGPNDYKPSQIGQYIKYVMAGKFSLSISGGEYNFVDVRDIADAIFNACSIGKIGQDYLLSGNNITINDFISYINEFAGINKKLKKLPIWLLKIVAKPVELFFRMRNISPIFTPCSLYTLTSNHCFNNSKAKHALNFTARPIKESVKDAVEFFNSINRKNITFKDYFNY